MPEYPFMSHTHMDDTMMLEWVIGERCEHAMRSLMWVIDKMFPRDAVNSKKFKEEGE